MSGQRNNRGLAFLLLAAAIGGTAAILRRFSLRHAAELLGTKIPRGAMAIRRESFVDLTVDGRPVRQTVFIAEAAGEEELLGEAVEELPVDEDVDEEPEPDPSEGNNTGTLTDVEPEDPATEPFNPVDLHAEAEAVLAEAERIEEDAEDSHLVEDELAADVALEESMGASRDDAVEDTVPVEETVEEPEVPQHVPAWEGSCPDSHPVKVRFATGRFHEPGSPAYEQVVADACYASIEAAVADGFSPSPL